VRDSPRCEARTPLSFKFYLKTYSSPNPITNPNSSTVPHQIIKQQPIVK